WPCQMHAQSSANKQISEDFGSRYRQKTPIKEKPKIETAPTSAVIVDRDAIAVETNLVVNVVTILDEHGVVVAGLTKDDFIFTEDGASVDLDFVRPDDSLAAPRSIVLLIDYSASQLPYIETSI